MPTETCGRREIAALETAASPGEGSEVDGKAGYILGKADGARLWVLADGSATLVRAVGPSTAPADLVFSDWGRAQTFTPPPASMVVEG